MSVHRIAAGGRALVEVGVLADELGLLDLWSGHPRLDQVVLELELGAVGPIALLEPAGRCVDADPDRGDAERPARLPEACPTAGAPAPSGT